MHPPRSLPHAGRTVRRTFAARLVVLVVLFATLAGTTPATAAPQERPSAGELTGIIAGSAAAPGAYPWQVAIETRGGGQFCGGSIVAVGVILTAAHCMEDVRASQLQIRAGTVRLDRAGQVRGVARVVVHPNYNPRSTSNDAALLFLDSPLTTGTEVQPIRYSGEPVARLSAHGTTAWVSGWGATDAAGTVYPIELRAAAVPVVGDAQCQQIMSGQGASIVASTMLCAGGGGTDSCYGDSGGPLMARDTNGIPYLIGIVSWGLDCALRGVPGVYTDVVSLAGWLQGQLGTPTTPTPQPPRPPQGGTTTVRSDVPVRIPAFGPGNPNPTAVAVRGAGTSVTEVEVILHGLTHACPSDLDIVLIAPDRTAVTLMAGAGGCNPTSSVTIRFDGDAAQVVPQRLRPDGRYRPIDRVSGGSLPPADLAVFDGVDPNGRWRLFVYDSVRRDAGRLAGWSLVITS